LADETQKGELVIIYVNAAGCPNSCRHCSVSGEPPYGEFYSLDDMRTIAGEWGPIVPYLEPTAHPDFPEIMDPRIVGEGSKILATTGSGLAECDDYTSVFDRLREFGYTDIFFTLHGLEEEHDWFVRRKGAFQAVLKASRRAAQAEFGIIWSVFLDQRNLEGVPLLQAFGAREFGLRSLYLEVPRHRVSHRMWLYEKLRPRLGDVKELLRAMDPETYRGWLKDRPLEELTESAWLSAWRRDPDSDEFQGRRDPKSWPEPPRFEVIISIDRNGQVHLDPQCGEPILLGKLSDGRDEILRRIQHIAAPPFSDMSPAEARLPDSDSDLLHPHGHSVRCKAISAAINRERRKRSRC
jgi:MoaA/NifB/PqqE/SkfB family radical SAM enzyme